MCGFSLYYSDNILDESLKLSIDKIAHRGPDDNYCKTWHLENGKIAGLGHVRLSIIDTSKAGRQPMISANKRIAMVFNGELYNHIDLRNELYSHQFCGYSDSEVLLEYYVIHGAAGFHKLRGMFAAAFIHLDTGKLIVVRDQLGIKPVYYAQDKVGIYFSSEIKGLMPFMDGANSKVSKDALFEFLNCGFVYEPDTGIEGVRKVPAGSYLEISDNSTSINSYFSLSDDRFYNDYNDSLIKNAVENQLQSDVKLGVFFSGGLDSSVIATYAKKDCLFASYDDSDFAKNKFDNDNPYALKISRLLGFKLITDNIFSDISDADSILNSMKLVATGTEELISDFTYIASKRLAQTARTNGYKVMLSGLGGDELFIGYPRYKLLMGGFGYRVLATALKIPIILKLARRNQYAAKKVDRFIEFFSEKRFPLAYSKLLGYLSTSEIESLWKDNDFDNMVERFNNKCEIFLHDFNKSHPLIKGMVLDYYGYLSHNLMVADKSSMSEGLELRVPLLDQDLYCAYFSSLRNGLINPKYGKKPLKDILFNLLPKSLIERKKAGFNPPLDDKINTIGFDRIITQLRESNLRNYINLQIAEDIVSNHFTGRINNTYKIWQLLYLSFWLNDKTC